MAHGPSAVPRIPEGFVVGAKAVLRAAAAEGVRRVIVAADAPAAATEPVRRLAAERHLTLVEVESSDVLGRFCGLPRPVAAAAEVVRGAVGTKVPA
jgi:ribosomal protein L7Ae-like RNA K-turn-binding protein